MQPETVKLTVNAGNLVRHLCQAFTCTETVLAELTQNARRAGASVVVFAVIETARTVSVEED